MDANDQSFPQYEKLYSFVMKKGVVSGDELEKYAKNEFNTDYNYLYRKFLFKLIQQGKVEKIKSGLFYGRNVYLDEIDIPNK